MTWKKILQFLFAGAIFLLFAGFFQGRGDLYFEVSKNMELFGKIYKEISFNYVDEIDPEQFMRAGIRGMLNSLDPYTIFVDEEKKGDIDLITNGKYGGIGISIGIRGEKVTIIEILEGYSAQKQGLKIGDILLEAGGVTISSDNAGEISSIIKGEPGTSVLLKIIRNEEKDTINFDLLREEIVVKNLTYHGFYPENSNNVYLKLSSFSRSAGDEIKKALRDLRAQKEIHSVVIDLRGNPGGLLDVSVDIMDKFLEKNELIVTTRGRDDIAEKKYYSLQEPMIKDAKIAVLINEGSASASEIIAGAFQDNDRGIVLGQKSFGKGLVQTIMPLNYSTSLKITTAKYYTPSGRSIQKVNYSQGNKVFMQLDSSETPTFYTVNGREVFGGGGITPDSTVASKIEGEITKQILAKGMVFKFADHYYNQNSSLNFETINTNRLFSDFEKFLKREKFEYVSEVEKQIEKLIEDVKKKESESYLIEELKNLRVQFETFDATEMKIYKNEILQAIKVELAARYLGSEGRIKTSLKNDNQFQTAFSILSDDEAYKKMLNN
jgi:carboxyl-terminal processing protease